MIRFCLIVAASVAIAAAQCDPGLSCFHTSGAPIATNVMVTERNPFKGFANNPLWSGTNPLPSFPSSLEFHYIALSEVMTGEATFDYDALELLLDASRGRGMHSVLRFFVDHPNDPTVNSQDATNSKGVPAYLLADPNPIDLNPYTEHGGGRSPDYHDERLIDAFVAFATNLGAVYDGDPRIAVVQIGLVGFWGEWHTYPDMAWMPSVTDTDRIIGAFDDAFNDTQLELRTPQGSAPASRKVGYHDDSFTYSTLDGEFNGRLSEPAIPWFMNRAAVDKGVSDAWMVSSIGGELRAENQATVFDLSFGAPAIFKQDFSDCVTETHTSWLLNYHAFAPTLGYTGEALSAAKAGAVAMGYQFGVQNVAACADTTKMSDSTCDHGHASCAIVTVTIQNDGVAPFYYDLAPVLEVDLGCAGFGETSVFIPNGAPTLKLLQPGDSREFVFSVAGHGSCVSNAGLRLQSAHAYTGNPVMLAHNHEPSAGSSPVQVVKLSMPAMPCAPVSPDACATTFVRPEDRTNDYPPKAACAATTMGQFSVECLRRPSFASGYLDKVDGLSALQCADLCLSKFACSSFTHIPRNGRCQLYAKLYKKTAFTTLHNKPDPLDEKTLFRRTPCKPACQANVMDRFTRAAGFRTQTNVTTDTDPEGEWVFTYPAWSLADGATEPPRDAAGHWLAADTDEGYAGGYRPKNAGKFSYHCSADTAVPPRFGPCTTVALCAQACINSMTARADGVTYSTPPLFNQPQSPLGSGRYAAPKCNSFNFRMNQTAGAEQCKFYEKPFVPAYLKEHSSSEGHKQFYHLTVGLNCIP